jgi:hypothetical protein
MQRRKSGHAFDQSINAAVTAHGSKFGIGFKPA